MTTSFLTRDEPDPVAATRRQARLVLRDHEARAGVDSLERLHHLRRKLVRKAARLKALYGPFGLADSWRKQMRATIATELRASEKRLTKDAAEDAAMADSRYKQLLESQIDGSIRLQLLQNRITEVEELIRNRDLAIQTYNKELGLQPYGRGHGP